MTERDAPESGLRESAPDQEAAGTRPPASAPLRSEQLLRGRKVVEITHNGEVYRLQATRLGKLILTK